MSSNPSDDTRNPADSQTQTTDQADELAAARARIEALEQELADAREGAEGSDRLVVVQELQRGYRYHDRVIRPTMVKVGLPPAEPVADAADAVVVDAEASEAPPSGSPAGSSGDHEQPVAS